MMTRAQIIGVLAGMRTTEPVVVGPGSSSGALFDANHLPATIYNMEMGYATAVCLGLALSIPQTRVVAVEGDGSSVAGLSTFTTIGRYQPANLVVLILDNQLYESCGDGTIPTATSAGTDLAAVARACGIPADRVVTVEDEPALTGALARALREDGPWILLAPVAPGRVGPNPANRSIPDYDLVETATAFKREMMSRGFRAR
jgi:sulfopyruvate decarboxylase subunit beta